MTTQLTAESSPVLDIEVFECEACGSKVEDLSYRRPLNSLEGRIRLSSKAELHLSHVEVSFQGSQSTVVVAYKSNLTSHINQPSSLSAKQNAKTDCASTVSTSHLSFLKEQISLANFPTVPVAPSFSWSGRMLHELLRPENAPSRGSRL